MRLRGSAGARPGAERAAKPVLRATGMSRRSLLIAGAAVPLAGCDVFDSADERGPAPTPTQPHPDDLVRARAIEAERALAELYQAAVAAHPELQGDLEPFADRHLRHIAAIESTVPASPSGSPTPPSAAPTPAGPPEIATDPDAAVRQLRDAELAAVEARTVDCLEARDHRLATVLASVAACEAAHDRLLRSLG
ncbi:MAG TPA: hypothetical protein VFY84_14565 [Jiangellales bacterium]|nr:hypothetical protein [Jiangellales bacterium]